MGTRSGIQRWLFGLGRRLPPAAVRAINLARGIDAPKLVDTPPGRRVVVVAPHPDDELIGCGGTLAKHLAAGHDVTVVMVTSGEKSASFVGQGAGAARSQREQEAMTALDRMGLGPDRVRFLRLTEGGLPDTPPPALIEALADADLVYCPGPADGHADHARVCRLVSAALARVPTVRQVALYEIMTPIHPTVVVDVTDHIDAKCEALRSYRSALASVDFVATARGLAAYRSVHAMHGRGYAEAFTLVTPAQLAELIERADRA